MSRYLLVVFLVFYYAASSYGTDKYSAEALWLPVSYKHYKSLLVKAADKAFAEKECYRLIEGTLLESRSTADSPHFRFHCRTEGSILFTIEVDGNTLALRNIHAERLEKVRLKELKQEQERLAIEKAHKLKEAEQYWGICEKSLKKKSRRFDGLQMLTALPPQPQIQDNTTYIYKVDFDATNTQRKLLSYRATCVISDLEDHRLSIKPRRK